MNRWIVCSAIALPLAIGAYRAGAVVPDPDSLPKVSCSDLRFSQAFLRNYPKAPAGCLEARVYHGQRYAKFNGKVYLKGPDALTVQIFNVAGDPLDTLTFKPSIGARLLINGQPEKFSDLKVGDPLTFWLPESRFSIYTAPGAKSASPVLPPAH